MDENLLDMSALEDVLSEFNEAISEEEVQNDELAASQKRYDDYIKKHKNDNK